MTSFDIPSSVYLPAENAGGSLGVAESIATNPHTIKIFRCLIHPVWHNSINGSYWSTNFGENWVDVEKNGPGGRPNAC
ncbi:MAG: hypothetical protein R3C97_17770 [Geminicoccaceae bacterium]